MECGKYQAFEKFCLRIANLPDLFASFKCKGFPASWHASLVSHLIGY